jgi:hypothetical protein
MRLASINTLSCVTRPPDWRWQRAGELLQQGRPLRRCKDYNEVAQVHRFRVGMNNARTADAHLVLAERYPDIYDAWSIYASEDRALRHEIEARILAREPFETIASKVAASSDVVTAYEKFFFNVTDRLDSPSYITHQVLDKALRSSPAERTPDFLWKIFGYWQGPMMVDAWVYRFNSPSRPDSVDGVAAALNDDFRLTLLFKADQLMRTMPVNEHSRTDILMTWCRLLEAERESGTQAGTDYASLMSGMQSVLEKAPWTKRVRKDSSAAGQIEATGVTIRACEYQLLADGTIPDSFQHLIEHTSFPEPTNAQATKTN